MAAATAVKGRAFVARPNEQTRSYVPMQALAFDYSLLKILY
jgi:hypothetical protein